MSTTYTKCFVYLVVISLYHTFILQCISAECQPEHKLCETYLTIYLQTAKQNSLSASMFESDFVKFAAAFHAMSTEVCEYDHITYPSLYYIHMDPNSTQYQYQFAIHLFCDTNTAQSISCCNDFYDHYLNKKSYGILVETWIKHVNKGTIWQHFDIEGRVVDYLWSYKLQNATFIAPTLSPTVSPLKYSINCEYQTHHLSIICALNPPYTTYKVSNNKHGLTIYERSSSLCTQVLDERSQSLELLGFECDDCNAAQCEFNNASYDQETHEIEIRSIEIWLTADCTLSVGDSLAFCIALDDDACEYTVTGEIQLSSYDSAISNTSISLLSPSYVSSHCMMYTIYDDIQSDFRITDTQSIAWHTNIPQTHFIPCLQGDYCTFSTGNTSLSSTEYLTTLSIETVYGSLHNISTTIQHHDNLAFTPLIFHTSHFVSFKPIYVAMDVILSCDPELINLNSDDWITSVDKYGSIFSTQWDLASLNEVTLNRNMFIDPSIYVQQLSNEEELITSLTLSTEALDVLSSTDALSSVTNTFVLTQIYGDINAIISNGMHQYFPYELNGNTVIITLTGNEYSFDQETESVSSEWQYLWTCEILQNDDLCPIQLVHDYDEPILQFTSNILQQDAVYLFTLQITDNTDQRSDQTFSMLTVSSSAVNIIVSVNVEWDKSMCFLPSYHASTAVIASIDDYITDNDPITWLYIFCFDPYLENGVQCESFETVNTSLQYLVDPFLMLPNHQYIVDVNITSVAAEYSQHGMVSTILQTASLPHIYDISVSSDYHQYNALSSNMYKTLYQDSDSLLQYVDIHLLSMKIDCFHPPCTYSYFYQIQNPKQATSERIPFYFALANGLSVSPLTGVIFPWTYDAFDILGCVEDIYGSINCELDEYSVSVHSTITEEICEYYTDIEHHLLLLQGLQDTLSLTQFMTTVVFQIVDAEYDDDECIEALIDLILYYLDEYVIDDAYFIYYPFHILQILYLVSEHNIIGPNAYAHFVDIYDIMIEEYQSSEQPQTYYLPYSSHNYIAWNVSFVLQAISYHHSVFALLDAVDLQCSPSSYSIINDDVYDIIYDISDVVSALLSQHPDEIIQHISTMLYLYARRFEFDVDAQKYRAFALNEHYINDNNNTLSGLQANLETMSVSRKNIEAGSNVELQLFSFNPQYITQTCFHDRDAAALHLESDDEAIANQYNITNKANLVYVSMLDTEDTEYEEADFIALVFSWKLSNATLHKLNTSNIFNIYCQQLDVENKLWSDANCESITDVDDSRDILPYFECECEGLRSGQTYALMIDLYQEDDSLLMQQTESTPYNIAALDRAQWIVFLVLFLLLLCLGYIFPLCFANQFAPSTKGQLQLFGVFYFYASVVLANFLMQIYLCVVGIMHDSTIWLWQTEVIFGLQCGSLGVYNVFLLVIVIDKKCDRFKVLTPFMISITNAILTAFIILFTCLHAIFIQHMDHTQYGWISWSLWLVYFGFICLIALFVVYLSYYWHKGKHFSGGTPYQYTEGKRESTAVLIMIGGAMMYSLSIINGYIVHALSNRDETAIDDQMRAFECIHWISLCVLAAVIFIVRNFEQHQRKIATNSTSNLKDDINHQIVPFTDESENDFEEESADAHSGIIPLPDGTANDHKSESFDDEAHHMKPLNNMMLLTSSIEPTDNIKRALIQQSSNIFSSTSEFDTDPLILQSSHRQHSEQKYRARIEEECDINTLAMNPWPQAANIPKSRTMNDTPSHLGTDALGNTMSYEPEIEMDFVDLPLCEPHTNTTNRRSEGMATPQSDPAHLNVAPLKVRTRSHKHRKLQHIQQEQEQYSPYSDRGDNYNQHIVPKQDHITAIGADEHAQNGGHFIGVTMSIPSNDEFQLELNANEALAPYSCYTANTHRRSTIDEAHSDPEAAYNNNQRSAHAVDASTSSMGIFDWNTPEPMNQIREISLGHLNLSGWIDGSHAPKSFQSRSGSQARGTPISRRHTSNSLHFGHVYGDINKRSPRHSKRMYDDDIEAKLREESYDDNGRYRAITPSIEEHEREYVERQNIPKLYGTGAGASVNMEHGNDSNGSGSCSPRAYVEKAHMNNGTQEEKVHKMPMHSRHTTATSMTATFTQPDYANILTVEHDDDHRNILKTNNLIAVPLKKTVNHLDSHQKEIVDIYEQKTNANEFEGNSGKHYMNVNNNHS